MKKEVLSIILLCPLITCAMHSSYRDSLRKEREKKEGVLKKYKPIIQLFRRQLSLKVGGEEVKFDLAQLDVARELLAGSGGIVPYQWEGIAVLDTLKLYCRQALLEKCELISQDAEPVDMDESFSQNERRIQNCYELEAKKCMELEEYECDRKNGFDIPFDTWKVLRANSAAYERAKDEASKGVFTKLVDYFKGPAVQDHKD